MLHLQIINLIQAFFIRANEFCLQSEICCFYHWLCPRIINIWRQVRFYLVAVTEISLVWSLAFSLGKLIPNDAAELKNWEFKFTFSAGWRRMHIYNRNSKLYILTSHTLLLALVAKLQCSQPRMSSRFWGAGCELSYLGVNSSIPECDKAIFFCFYWFNICLEFCHGWVRKKYVLCSLLFLPVLSALFKVFRFFKCSSCTVSLLCPYVRYCHRIHL